MTHGVLVPQFWSEEPIRGLPPLTKLVAAFLITGRPGVDIPGLLNIGVGALAEELELTPEDTRAALGRLVEVGWAEVDYQNRMIRVPNAPKYNPPRNGRMVKGIFRRWNTLPSCALRMRHVESIRDAVKLESDDVIQAWERTFGTVLPVVSETVSHTVPHTVPETLSQLVSKPTGTGTGTGSASATSEPQTHARVKGGGPQPVPGVQPQPEPQAPAPNRFDAFVAFFEALFEQRTGKPYRRTVDFRGDRLLADWLHQVGLDEAKRLALLAFEPGAPDCTRDLYGLARYSNRLVAAEAMPRAGPKKTGGMSAAEIVEWADELERQGK